ncbi:MAG: PqqD family protein [Dehalococcoidia bacterium]
MQLKERLYLLSERLSEGFRPCQNRDVTLYQTEEQVTLYDPQTEQVHLLDPTAATVWQLCNGVRGVQDIVGKVADSSGVAPDMVAEDVVEALERFQQTQLVLDQAKSSGW